MIWNKITEVKPQPDKDYLVWTGSYMFVARARFCTDEQKAIIRQHLKESEAPDGSFEDIGTSYYFDDNRVYWMELPHPPGQKPQENPLEDPDEGLVERNKYLRKDGQIVGIHAIGYANPANPAEFDQMEIWGNQYDNEHNMLGPGSFRVFDTFENEVKNWEADGWEVFDGPKPRS